jgi:glycosyltransferase involved in cell wall biosynthesis
MDAGSFRRAHGLEDGIPTVTVVSRLDRQMKAEGIAAAIDAIRGMDVVARLVIVGTGDAEGEIAARAQDVNRRLGRDAIVLTGPMLDPRPAYAAADVVIGMGSSALRGMAFAKPVVVVGERRFSRVVAPETIDWFLREGFYGIGDGRDPVPSLQADLTRLLGDDAARSELGVFGRALVEERFDLRVAAGRLDAFYQRVAAEGGRIWGVARDSLRIGTEMAWEGSKVIVSRARRRVARAAGPGGLSP